MCIYTHYIIVYTAYKIQHMCIYVYTILYVCIYVHMLQGTFLGRNISQYLFVITHEYTSCCFELIFQKVNEIVLKLNIVTHFNISLKKTFL